jgi:hypothetical protein
MREGPSLAASALPCSWISRPHKTGSPRLGTVPAYSPRTHPVGNRSRNDRDEAHMSWSLNIGKVAGTVVRLHITFLLFLGWIFVSNYASSGPTGVCAAARSISPVESWTMPCL